MKDTYKTKQQLIDEVRALRRRISESEAREADQKFARLAGRSTEVERRMKDSAVESSINGIAFTDLEGSLIYVNSAFLDMWEWASEEEILGSPFAHFWEEEGRAWEIIRELRYKRRWTGELIAKKRDGSTFDVQVSANMVTDSAGGPLCMMGSFLDISRRKEVERALQESEKKYRRLFESTKEGIIISGPDGRVISANSAAAAILGFNSSDEIEGRPMTEFYDDPLQRERLYDALIQKGHIDDFEAGFKRKDGSKGKALASLTLHRDGEDNILRAEGLFRDITERNKMEEALRRSEERFRAIVENMPGVVYCYEVQPDRSRLLDYVGSGLRELLDQPPAEKMDIEPDRFFELIHPDDRLGLEKRGIFDPTSNDPVDTEYRVRGSSGEYKWLRSIARPFQVADGVIRWYGLLLDITDRKRAEEALRKSEEKYRDLVENINEVIYSINAEGIVTYVSPSVRSFMEYTPFEIIGRHFHEFVYREDLARMRKSFLSILSGKSTANEYRVLSKSGEVRWARASSRPLFVQGQLVGIHGISTDITEQKQAEEILIETRSQLEHLLGSSAVVIYRCEPSEYYPATFISQNVKRQLGYEPEDFTKNPTFWVDHIHPEDAQRILAELSQLFEKGYHRQEYRFLHKDGTYRWMYDEVRLIRDAAGEPLDIIGSWVDITDRKKTEQALRESEEKYRILVERANDGIVIVQDRVLKYANQQLTEIVGYSVDETIDSPFTDYIYEDQLSKVVDFYERRMAGENVSPIYESALRNKTGQRIDVEFNAGLVPYEGRPADLVIIRDITERKQVERALRESEEKARALLNTSSAIVALIKTDGTVLDANETMFERFGKRYEDFIGSCIWDSLSSEVAERRKAAVDQVVQSGKLRNFEDEREGVWYHTIVEPIFNEEGNVTKLIILAHDITDRKTAEIALQESEEKFRGLAEQSPNMIFINRRGKIVYVNKRCEEIMGYRKEEFYSPEFDFLNLIAPEFKSLVTENYDRHMRGTSTLRYEYAILNNEGKRREAIISTKLIQYEEDTAILGVVTDITERKQVEAALRESEQQYRSTINSMGDPIHVIDSEFRFVLFNKAFVQWNEKLGLETEVLGRTLFEVFPFLMDSVRKEYQQVFETGQILITEERTNIQDQEFVTETRKIPVFEGRKVTRIVTVVRDITERKRAEEQIRASLREKEALLKEMHHRVKNNLQVVSGLLLLQSRDIKDKHAVEMLNQCQIRIKTLAMIHEKLYQTEDVARINFTEYVRALAAELIQSYGIQPDDIELKIHMDDILLGLDTAIPCGLIINELLSNSLKHAFPEGEKGVIQIDFHKQKDKKLTLVVRDDGIGFPKDVDSRNTTTLGLQLVNTLTDQLGGTIELDRSGGTAFTITFTLDDSEIPDVVPA